MTPSKQAPQYTCAIVSQSGTTYDISSALTSLDLSERKGQIAACARVKCANLPQGDTHLNSLITVRDRVFIYADDGEGKKEVFRGFVWTVNYASGKSKDLTFTCYDILIYFQKSEERRYFPNGKSSKDICTTLCSEWNVELSYTYESITHGKMALRGSLSDIFLSDVLDEVKKQTGKKYVMRAEEDVVKILPAGNNETVYELKRKENVLSTKSELTMDGMITKVVIHGKEDKDGNSKVEAEETGDTGRYGTLQKIQSRNQDTSLAEAKKEAGETIKEKGAPTCSYTVEATDIPFIHKGDKVKVAAGDMVSTYLVVGATHAITSTKKTMSLELENL